jgi:hypothetical protein
MLSPHNRNLGAHQSENAQANSNEAQYPGVNPEWRSETQSGQPPNRNGQKIDYFPFARQPQQLPIPRSASRYRQCPNHGNNAIIER